MPCTGPNEDHHTELVLAAVCNRVLATANEFVPLLSLADASSHTSCAHDAQCQQGRLPLSQRSLFRSLCRSRCAHSFLWLICLLRWSSILACSRAVFLVLSVFFYRTLFFYLSFRHTHTQTHTHTDTHTHTHTTLTQFAQAIPPPVSHHRSWSEGKM